MNFRRVPSRIVLRFPFSLAALAFTALALGFGCSTSVDTTEATGGVSPGTGGSRAGTGGGPGGSPGSGGVSATGGFLGSGGLMSTGGTVATGGTSSGGAQSAGGAISSGGRAGTGGGPATGGAGTTATGGSTGTGGSGAGGATNGTGGTVVFAGPPMGYNPYNSFWGNATETEMRQIADAMATNGMRDAGYTYVNVDEGWQGARDSSGTIQAGTNFPSGIKAFADYVHGKGFKFGIYTAPGNTTCANRTGSGGHVTQDVTTYASWGVDYIKLDWCGADYSTSGATAIAQSWKDAIAASGRPMVLSINAGANTSIAPWASTRVTMWRTGDDICASWFNKTQAHNPATSTCSDVTYHNGIYDYLYANIAPNGPYQGAGHWADEDMLQVGNAGLSLEESKTHFSVWAMWSAPLIAGNDPRKMNGSDDASKVLLNKEVIALDQDAKNAMATKVKDTGGLQIWKKTLAASGTLAAALVNASNATATMTLNWSDLGWTTVTSMRDLWARAAVTPGTSNYAVSVPAHGTVLLTLAGH